MSLNLSELNDIIDDAKQRIKGDDVPEDDSSDEDTSLRREQDASDESRHHEAVPAVSEPASGEDIALDEPASEAHTDESRDNQQNDVNTAGEDDSAAGALPDELPEVDFAARDDDPSTDVVDGPFGPDDEAEPAEEETSEPSGQALSHEIRDFEEAITEIYGDDPETTPDPRREESFFAEVESFVENNDVDVLSDLLSRDLVSTMKEYHQQKQEGNEYFFHDKEVKRAVKERLHRLRELEQEWYDYREQLHEAEQALAEKEQEMGATTDELKELLRQVKDRQEFTTSAQEEDHFYAADGRVITSLRDLRAALRVMDDEVFARHMRPENDFAAWVEEVFEKPRLAKQLRQCKSRGQMVYVLNKAA